MVSNRKHWKTCRRSGCTLHSGEEPADAARRKGWKVGDVVEGDEGYGPERLTITAIGEDNLLVRSNSEREHLLTLNYRCWRKVRS